jgi:hypothetical protein
MKRLVTVGRGRVVRPTALVVLGMALALAAGSGSGAATASSVSIAPKAYVFQLGGTLGMELTIQCDGGTGSAQVTVTQTAAQSSNGQGASGTSNPLESANCDGRPHKLSVTVIRNMGGFFDIGKAEASATLIAPSGTATDTREIDIVSP